MTEIAIEVLFVLMLVGFCAGMVDAIAGGGGLITMPALLWAGLSPAQALATNKLQSTWGSMAATINYRRSGRMSIRRMWLPVLTTFFGAAAGAIVVQQLDPRFLERFIPILLMAAVLYFLLQPRLGELDRQQRISLPTFAFTCGLGIGFYDGFFGPGTGSFFAVSFVSLLGFNLIKATAHTKLLNFTSNFASLIFFIIGGNVVWKVGLCMAVGQLAGGWLGSHLTLRHGGRLVRPLLVTVSLLMILRILWSDPDSLLRQWLAGWW